MTIIFVIILIGLYLSIWKPYYFVIFYGLVASETGARGISGYFNTFFPDYSLIMRVLMVVAAAVSLVHYYYSKNQFHERAWIKIALLFIASMCIMLTLYSFELSFMSYISRLTLAICTWGPAVFLIWLSYYKEFDHVKLFYTYSIIQCLLAIFIIYGSYWGITNLQMFNAGNYNAGFFYLDETNDMVAMPSNFYLVFLGKNEHFIRCGQFHNSNGLGFASGIMFFLCICWLKVRKNIYRIMALLGMGAAFLLWCNTGTRAPIIGIIIAFFFFLQKNSREILSMGIPFILFFVLVFAIVSSTENSFVNYFFGSGTSDSFASRKLLNDNTFEHIFEYLLFGTAGDLDSLIERNIDPHELPLRILCLYGIIPSIIVTYLTIIKPIKMVMNRSNLSFYTIGLLMIVLLVSLTNNYSETTLYWIALGESIISANMFNIYENKKWITVRK